MRMVHTNALSWPLWLRRLVGGHWFRPAGFGAAGRWADDEPCAFGGCGRPGREHWRWSGEWRLPRREQWRLSLRRVATVRRARRDGAR